MEVFEDMPHRRALGMRIIELRYGNALMEVPYHENLIGNPATGVIHGGVITAFLDTLCGFAAISSVSQGTAIATLDLRIDYLRPAEPKVTILGSAECYKVTRNIAFVRGIAYQETFRDPIANCVGTFMLGAASFTAEGSRRATPDQTA
jgi:uncharacterized protein (TIGR00369 family)